MRNKANGSSGLKIDPKLHYKVNCISGYEDRSVNRHKNKTEIYKPLTSNTEIIAKADREICRLLL